MKNLLYKLLASRIRPIELASLLKRILFIKRRIYKLKDFSLFIDPVSNLGWSLISSGEYEPHMERVIRSSLTEGDVFIDLGANEGYFSILASTLVGKKGMVYSIEPQFRLHSIITKNVNINRVYNVTLIPFAMSDSDKELQLTLSPTINSGSSTIVSDRRRKLWKKQSVNATQLDNYFLHLGIESIKLLKIDIEGFELFALYGAKNLLKDKLIKNIIVETHSDQLNQLGHSVEMIDDFLTNYGYLKSNSVYSVD